MYLKELIEELEKYDPEKIVSKGFYAPHSYRGYYNELAFVPIDNTTVGAMLVCAKEALDTTYTGYKGGEFKMGEYTDIWLANHGSTGEAIGHLLLSYMLYVEPPTDGLVIVELQECMAHTVQIGLSKLLEDKEATKLERERFVEIKLMIDKALQRFKQHVE